MSNGFFNATGKPIDSSEITSAEIRDEFAAIAAGFDKLPTLSANAYKIVYVNASSSALDIVGGSGLLKLSTTGIPAVATLGTGIETFLATPSSANLAAAVTDESGTGALLFAGGNMGTPSSLVGTNITGTAAGLTAGAVITNANLTGHVTSVGNAAVLGSFTVAQLSAAISDANISGTNTGDQTITLTGGVTGSGTGSFAATVVTNANLTGHVTSVGNAAVLGSFTLAQLNTAVSDADVAVLGAAQTFTAPQRGTQTTDNDGSFDLNATNNFKCTPTGAVAITFTNIASATGQSGNILLVNGSNHAITAAATTKAASGSLTTLSATGTYLIGYYCDGSNVYVGSTAALA